MTSNPDLLAAFRKQCEHVHRNGGSTDLVLVGWHGQRGVDQDDLIDIAREVEGL